jgi:hypothetical protein
MDLNYPYIQYILQKCEIKIEFITLIEMAVDSMAKVWLMDKFRGHIVPMRLRNT